MQHVVRELESALSLTNEAAFRALARRLTADDASRADKMGAFVDELHRRSTYERDVTSECIAIPTPDYRGPFDADDACLFVGALARSVGITCRLVGARFGRGWTCLLDYEAEDGSWKTIDPLRQCKREPDEVVIAEF